MLVWLATWRRLGGWEEMDHLKKEDKQEWIGFMWLRTLSSKEHSDAAIRFKIS
jgi:hypothetical protein